MLKIRFTIFFLLVTATMFATNVVVKGSAVGYEGKQICVFGIEDYLSEKRILVAKTEINSTGQFQLNFDVSKTRAVIISIQRIEATLYVDPSGNYEVKFPQTTKTDIKKFDKTEVNLILENIKEDDVNVLIRLFNNEYAEFISAHYYDFAATEYHGSDAYMKSLGDGANKVDIYKKKELEEVHTHDQKQEPFYLVVEKFNEYITKKYEASFSQSFFADYVKYSLAELDLMSGMDRKKFYRMYFMSQRVLPDHPSYMSCFSAFYHHFLTGKSKEVQSVIIKAVNQNKDAAQLIKLFESDSTSLGKEVRSLAVIKGLNEIYFDKTYTRHAIEKTLQNFPNENPELKTVADNVLHEMIKCKEGWLLEDFTVADEKGDKWNLKENTQTPVYMMFFATWNTSSLKELQMMQNLYSKYGDKVLFVAISLDDDYETFKKYFQEHKEQKFTFLYGGRDPMLTYQCDIRTMPHAIMLDQDGKVMYTFTRKPSEGIQLDLDKLVAVMKQQPNQGPKTWKAGSN